jgi:hypothetical protein
MLQLIYISHKNEFFNTPDREKIRDRLKGLWLKWSLDLPSDFICYKPEESEKLKKEVSIVSEAIREGVEI